MTAPRIRPIPAPSHVPDSRTDSMVWFVVTAPGHFRGRWFDRAEILACKAGARPYGSDVVLVPVGRGAPALGAALGANIVGAYGEPCSPLRWHVLGAIIGRWRWCAQVGTWREVEAAGVAPAERPQGAQAQGAVAWNAPRPVTAALPSAEAPQLSLFSRAA